jgi:hypothetical protein
VGDKEKHVSDERVLRVAAYYSTPRTLVFWCDDCFDWHEHGVGNPDQPGGWRATHCAVSWSSWPEGTVDLVPVGPWTDDVRRAVEREAWTRRVCETCGRTTRHPLSRCSTCGTWCHRHKRCADQHTCTALGVWRRPLQEAARAP